MTTVKASAFGSFPTFAALSTNVCCWTKTYGQNGWDKYGRFCPGRPALSFSEDDCTRQRGLKAVVQSSIERTVSGVRCTNDDLKPVLVALATDQPLDVRYRDHDLSGDWAGYRECHIKPDLLLIYRKSDADTLRLARLGSHSELFG